MVTHLQLATLRRLSNISCYAMALIKSCMCFVPLKSLWRQAMAETHQNNMEMSPPLFSVVVTLNLSAVHCTSINNTFLLWHYCTRIHPSTLNGELLHFYNNDYAIKFDGPLNCIISMPVTEFYYKWMIHCDFLWKALQNSSGSNILVIKQIMRIH